jgi:hypothetical protein
MPSGTVTVRVLPSGSVIVFSTSFEGGARFETLRL